MYSAKPSSALLPGSSKEVHQRIEIEDTLRGVACRMTGFEPAFSDYAWFTTYSPNARDERLCTDCRATSNMQAQHGPYAYVSSLLATPSSASDNNLLRQPEVCSDVHHVTTALPASNQSSEHLSRHRNKKCLICCFRCSQRWQPVPRTVSLVVDVLTGVPRLEAVHHA